MSFAWKDERGVEMERFIFTKENMHLMRYRWQWRHGAVGIFGLYGPIASGKATFLSDCFEDREIYHVSAGELYQKFFKNDETDASVPLSDFRQFVPGEPIILIDYLNELQGKDNIRTAFYQMAKEWADRGKLVIFTSDCREDFQQTENWLTLIEITPAPVNEFTVNCICYEKDFWPDDEGYRTLLNKNSLIEAEVSMELVMLFSEAQTEPRQQFSIYTPTEADQNMYFLFSSHLDYELARRKLKDEDTDELVYLRSSAIPQGICEEHHRFFSGDSFIIARMLWGKRMMLGLYQPERYQKMLEQLQAVPKEFQNRAHRIFYRYIAASAVDIERQGDEIPAVEALFWSINSSDDEKEGLPKKIRCYFIENGERAVLIPENEFQEPEQKFWRF